MLSRGITALIHQITEDAAHTDAPPPAPPPPPATASPSIPTAAAPGKAVVLVLNTKPQAVAATTSKPTITNTSNYNNNNNSNDSSNSSKAGGGRRIKPQALGAMTRPPSQAFQVGRVLFLTETKCVKFLLISNVVESAAAPPSAHREIIRQLSGIAANQLCVCVCVCMCVFSPKENKFSNLLTAAVFDGLSALEFSIVKEEGGQSPRCGPCRHAGLGTNNRTTTTTTTTTARTAATTTATTSTTPTQATACWTAKREFHSDCTRGKHTTGACCSPVRDASAISARSCATSLTAESCAVPRK